MKLLDALKRVTGKLKESDARWPFIVIGVVICVWVISASGLFVRPDPSTMTLSQYMQYNYNTVKARVLSVDSSELSEEPYIENMMIGVQTVELELLQGPHKGEVFNVRNTLSRLFKIHLKPGMTCMAMLAETEGEVERVQVYGYNRDYVLYGLVAVFFAVVLMVGGRRGFYSIASLVFTLIVVVFFMVPRVMEGYDPILMAILTSALTTVFTILVVSGYNAKSGAAVAGIVLGVAVAGFVAIAAGSLGNLSGIHLAEAEEMIYLTQEMPIKVPELFTAGIIISALGAIMDIGISISSSVFEVSAANPQLTARELYRSGMNVGRDVIGTMTNTLILAFVGSSMAVIIIMMLSRLGYLMFINLNILGLEIIQGIAGSVGLVFTVPMTAFCAAGLASAKARRVAKNAKAAKKAAKANKVEGGRR
jgi:uncharacterized membrane protein